MRAFRCIDDFFLTNVEMDRQGEGLNESKISFRRELVETYGRYEINKQNSGSRQGEWCE